MTKKRASRIKKRVLKTTKKRTSKIKMRTSKIMKKNMSKMKKKTMQCHLCIEIIYNVVMA